MHVSIVENLFIILSLAFVGGAVARFFKSSTLVGYMVAGVLGGFLLNIDFESIQGLSEIGLILLLFSVGLELSFESLAKVGKIAITGSFMQMLLTSSILFLIINFLFPFNFVESLVLALGFCLSSTAVVVKLLEDKGESETLHGQVMVGWLLTQDLAVIPLLSILPAIALTTLGEANFINVITTSMLTSAFLVIAIVFLGKMVAPYLSKLIAVHNSRELIVLGGVVLALGTAFLVSLFGVSAALGAFLAGVVISETQENHAIFAETRPLRDLFVILFFVTLGFFVSVPVIYQNIFLILVLTLTVFVVKTIVVYSCLAFLGYRGKLGVVSAFGLSQIGEFSFILFLSSQDLGIFNEQVASIGISVTLFSLLLTPLMFASSNYVWKKLKKFSFFKEVIYKKNEISEISNHVIICGYGRMGSWIGKAMLHSNFKFVVIDYNDSILKNLRKEGILTIYGDASEPLVLKNAAISRAQAVVIAIPDSLVQDELIMYLQNNYPNVKVYARAHSDKEAKRLSRLGVEKVIQPEFEAAVSVTKELMKHSGKSLEEIKKKVKSLRLSHAKI